MSYDLNRSFEPCLMDRNYELKQASFLGITEYEEKVKILLDNKESNDFDANE